MAKLTQFNDDLHSLIKKCVVTNELAKELDAEAGLEATCAALANVRNKHQQLYVVGNGGSAAIASHVVTDLTNWAKLRATTLHDPALLTCMTNDYGYENAYARLLKQRVSAGDALIAISSSGKSPNILNAAKVVREAGGCVITLSGFKSDNPLRRAGHFNIWLNSGDYGLVEVGHLLVLHVLAGRLKVK